MICNPITLAIDDESGLPVTTSIEDCGLYSESFGAWRINSAFSMKLLVNSSMGRMESGLIRPVRKVG